MNDTPSRLVLHATGKCETVVAVAAVAINHISGSSIPHPPTTRQTGDGWANWRVGAEGSEHIYTPSASDRDNW